MSKFNFLMVLPVFLALLQFSQAKPYYPEPPLPGRGQITLYQHDLHKGQKYEQVLGNRCYNLPTVVDNWASSVDTGNRCAVVCEERDCKGRCRILARGTPGHWRLSEIGMNDIVSSVKPCRAPVEVISV